MILQEKFTLSNGVEIPKLGLGTAYESNAAVDFVIAENDLTYLKDMQPIV